MLNKICDLNLGFSDAQNYGQKSNKEMFNEIFVKNVFLESILEKQRYFLIGEKGTGKTAYATYLSNNNYKNNISYTQYLSATDYEKFYTMKKRKKLSITDYPDIWKVILLLSLSKFLVDNKQHMSFISKRFDILCLIKAIDNYYLNAFSPEFDKAIKVVSESDKVAKLLINEVAEIGVNNGSKVESTEIGMQTYLLFLERQFMNAIDGVSLKTNIIMFVDGIDVRPGDMPYEDYMHCIKGLANAAWYLNTDFFQNIKGSVGRIKIVLLLRPDIYSSLNLQNSANKLMDNAVFLDWRTTYKEYKDSFLYKLASKLLLYKQCNLDELEQMENVIVEKYFDWKLTPTSKSRKFDTAFMAFLRISLSRPRDISVIFQYIRKVMLQRNMGEYRKFSSKCFESDVFQNMYSEYFLTSLKDQLSFYYSEKDYANFLKFIRMFDNAEFSYEIFEKNYMSFIKNTFKEQNVNIPEFFDEPQKLLQLLYDANMIASIKSDINGKYFAFSYREKNSFNISPEVLMGNNILYRFHYGMYKKNKFGRF